MNGPVKIGILVASLPKKRLHQISGIWTDSRFKLPSRLLHAGPAIHWLFLCPVLDGLRRDTCNLSRLRRFQSPLLAHSMLGGSLFRHLSIFSSMEVDLGLSLQTRNSCLSTPPRCLDTLNQGR